MFKKIVVSILAAGSLYAADPEFKNKHDFDKDIVPLLDKYCYRCHDDEKQKGDVNLSIFKSPKDMLGERKLWLEALYLIEEGEMPTKAPLPAGDDLKLLTQYIDSVVNGIDWTKVKNPGFEEPSRMNTKQYANTLRDLLGLDLPIEKYFLQDAPGRSGFSNDRGSAFLSTDRLKLYMKIANKSLESSLFAKQTPLNESYEAIEMSNGSNRTLQDERGVGLTLEQMILTQNVDVKTSGYYTFTIKSSVLWKKKNLSAPLLYLYVDGRVVNNAILKGDGEIVSTLSVFLDKGIRTIGLSAWKSSMSGLPEDELVKFKKEERIRLKKDFERIDTDNDGRHSVEERAVDKKLEAAFNKVDKNKDGYLDDTEFVRYKTNPKKNAQAFKQRDLNRDGRMDKTEFYYDKLRVSKKKGNEFVTLNMGDNFWGEHYGLSAGAIRGLTNTTFIKDMNISGPSQYKAPFDLSENMSEATIKQFLSEAFRRPASSDELERYYSFYTKNSQALGHEEALLQTMTAILVSPKFLTHSEGSSAEGEEYKLTDFELASRLSYFLWMSKPDKELMDLAKAGKLNKPEVLNQQVERMLADPKSKSFTSTFTEEWLGIAELGVTILPIGFQYPKFNVEVIRSSKEQTRVFVHKVFEKNSPLSDFIDSNYTYVNRVLGQFYELDDWVKVPADEFVRVKVDRKRGGILGQSSVLTVTSAPTRTNPIVRGIWILEKILGVDIPPPDPNAGTIPANAGTSGKMTIRQIFEEHRKNPSCASCHEKIDPVGFSMENYDGIGLWREQYKGNRKIDTSAVMPSGHKFDGALELRDVINERRDEVVRNLTEKMFSFALGRRTEYFDEKAIQTAIGALENDGLNAQTLIKSIVNSYPFQYKQSPDTEAH